MDLYKFSVLFVLIPWLMAGQKQMSDDSKIVVDIPINIVDKKFPEFSWDTMPLYMFVRKNKAFSNKEIEYLSKFPLITFPMSTGHKTYGSTEEGILRAAKAIKKINPKTKILYYKNAIINWPSYKEDEEFLKKKPQALLLDTNGNKALMPNNTTDFFDISKKYVRAYWLQHVGKMTQNSAIDGLFIDANLKALLPVFFKNRNVSVEKQKQISNGYLSMMKDLANNLGKDNLLLANLIRVRPEFEDSGRSYLNFFDGSYIEGFEHENFGMTYADYLAEGIEAVQKSAREGHIIAMTLGIGDVAENSEVGFYDQRKGVVLNDTFSDRLDYLLAIFLVCAEKYSYVYPHDGYSVNEKKGENDSSVWLKTFPQYQYKLGAPIGPAKKEGYIYKRSFEHLDVWLDIENKKAKLNWK